MVYLIESDINKYLRLIDSSFLLSMDYSNDVDDEDVIYTKRNSKFKVLLTKRVNGIVNITGGYVDSLWDRDIIIIG